jgi:large subunit ribosomal protein L29
MAMLRAKEIRAMRPDDIRAKFKELSDELMHERGVAAMGGAPASPGRIRALRTEVARIHTIIRELEVAEAVKAGPKKPAPDTKSTKEKEEKRTGPKPKVKKEKAEKPKKEEKK